MDMKEKKEKTSKVGESTQTEQKKKSKVQLFMEEMQQTPMIKIIDMRSVLR
jgi:hypothetical protein